VWILNMTFGRWEWGYDCKTTKILDWKGKYVILRKIIISVLRIIKIYLNTSEHLW
jgi:hypothetical protein